MAIAALFEFPDAGSLEKYDQVLEQEPETKAQPHRQTHVCWETPGGGFSVLDVWDSEEAFGKFGEILGPILAKVGLEGAPKIFPVHNTM